MNEFQENREIYRSALRGTYIIMTLKYSQKLDLKELKVEQSHEGPFLSDDWTDLLVQKCKIENGFVKRFILEQKVEDICFKKKETENTETKYAETGKVERIPVEEVQLFIFDNGIALLSMLLVYENVQTPYIYDFINPGYVNDQKEDLCKNVVSLGREHTRKWQRKCIVIVC